METLKSYLSGEFCTGKGAATALVNPTTEVQVAETSTAGLDLRAAMNFGRTQGGPALRELSFAQRGALLKQMSKALHEVRDALIDVSIMNGGTTRNDAKFDIDGGIGTLAYYAELGAKLGDARYVIEGEHEQLTRSARFTGVHVRVPRQGIAVHINAFNFPTWGLAEKAAVAILAGVPVITKPSPITALLAARVVERIVESKILPAGALQFLCGDANDLLEHLGPQDVLAFTGSGKTGELMRGLRAVVGNAVRLNVEADSLNAAVLLPDVEAGTDLYATFIRDVVREVTQKTGQKCTAIRRVLVPRALADRVQSDLAEKFAEIKIGDPALEEVRMGPVVSANQLKSVRDGVAELEASGARIVSGSVARPTTLGAPEGKGYFVGPVLLRADDAARATAVHHREVFGPVTTLLPYDDAQSIAATVGLGQGSLATSVYGDSREILGDVLLGVAPWSGRVVSVSSKVADQAISPGMVLPSCVHGGPGRAGGGEELGGERALHFYSQRVAIQGDRPLMEKLLGSAQPKNG